jgi:hypothetical protein
VNLETFHRWLELEIEQRNLSAQLEQIKQKQIPLESAIREELIQGKVDRITLGGYTISIGVDRYPIAKDGDRDALAEALKQCGLGEYCPNVNLQRLRSWLSETIDAAAGNLTPGERLTFDAHSAIPEQLRPHLDYSEKYRIRASRI